MPEYLKNPSKPLKSLGGFLYVLVSTLTNLFFPLSSLPLLALLIILDTPDSLIPIVLLHLHNIPSALLGSLGIFSFFIIFRLASLSSCQA